EREGVGVSVAVGVLSEKKRHAFVVHRMGDQVALTILATEQSQLLILLFSLNPFRNHFHSEIAREGRNCADDRVVVVSRQTRYERTIDLQIVEREPVQVTQRRITSAKVINTELHAERTQLLEHQRG